MRNALSLLLMAAAATVLAAPFACAVAEPDAQPTELDLPVDDSLQLSVDGVLPSSFADRIAAPCTIFVRGAGVTNADCYCVPVDSPYGGIAQSRPRLIGQAARGPAGMALRWQSIEPDRYLKLFAVVRKRNAPDRPVRTKTVDVCMSGPRYRARP